MTRRFVITGGPGFGKTSIISALEAKGYFCFHEFSRSLIKEQLAVGGDILPWKNLESFSRIVFEMRLKQFEEAPENQTCFYDRGIPDVIAYLNKDGIELNSYYTKALEEYNYNNIVFLTPPWKEIFVNDTERMENFNASVEAHQHIKSTYEQLGYTTIDLPKLSIKDRIEFILSSVNS